MEEAATESGNLSEISSRVLDDLGVLRAALSARAEELTQGLFNYTRAHPYLALGVAFSSGYLLAGGLLSRTTAKVVRLGARLAISQLLSRLITEARTAPSQVH
jgi:hypothetical protein